jgi:hypothetical protein
VDIVVLPISVGRQTAFICDLRVPDTQSLEFSGTLLLRGNLISGQGGHNSSDNSSSGTLPTSWVEVQFVSMDSSWSIGSDTASIVLSLNTVMLPMCSPEAPSPNILLSSIFNGGVLNVTTSPQQQLTITIANNTVVATATPPTQVGLGMGIGWGLISASIVGRTGVVGVGVPQVTIAGNRFSFVTPRRFLPTPPPRRYCARQQLS